MGVLVIGGLTALIIQQEPETVFKREFMGDGKCLDGTAYDSDQGAIMTTRSAIANLVVTPENPNDHSPAMLLFDVNKREGWRKYPEFTPADGQTQAYLGQLAIDCPVK